MDLIEELKRYRNDLETNNTKTKIYKNNKFRSIEWSNIKIGNLIKVKKNEIIPADLFVVCSSNKNGTFYLQTANLDGESNLKEREVLMNIQKIFYKKQNKNENYLENIFEGYDNKGEENCYIEVDQPNKNIYLINGKIVFNNKDKYYFDIKNTAIRGAILKNTNFIYGIIIYSGKETKIMQNFIKYKNKFAYLDELVDDIILVIIIIRLTYVIIFMLIGMHFRYKYMPNYEENKLGYEYIFYFNHTNGIYDKKNSLENLKYFTSHFILSQTLLPTSVAVLLAITKIIQSLFLEFFEKSLRAKPNQKMKCFSSELLGELGSIKYIFSDKTGTLTKNQTQFKACSIFTSLFDESNEKSDSELFNTNKTKNNTSSSNFSLKFNVDNLLNRLKLRNIPLDLKNIENCPFNNQGEAMEEFVLNMALNHDIIVDNFNDDENDIKNDNIKYQGTNPDEITLVGAAKELGFLFQGKVGNILNVKRIFFTSKGKEEKSEIKKYELLLKIPFSSERQRSTIIVRDLKTNKIKLYIKGSDTKLLKKINDYSQENILEITKEHVDNFARRGLRTLCYAFRIIPENECNRWFNEYNKLKENTSKDKDKIENNLIEEIESHCYLLGATALEDQMQDDVKKDIQQFIKAGINFWMLTGDKMDTAESIGHSIKLFDSDTEVYKINELSEELIIKRMEEIKQKIKETQNELSKLTLEKEIREAKRMDFNTKINLFKKRIKDNIEVIYEENDDGTQKENNNLNDLNSNLSEMRLKTKNKVIENGMDKIIINENENKSLNNEIENINNVNNILNNLRKDISNSNKQKRTEQIENMSILKFMIDNQYFENSSSEIEHLSIIKSKVELPKLIFSFNEKDKDSLNNIKINTSTNYDIITNNNNNESKEFKLNGRNEDRKTDESNKEYNNLNSETVLNLVKKDQRLKINLPITAEEFLKYFETCIEKSKKSFYDHQKSFFLFKIPYLYGPVNKEQDPITEDIKKKDWKEKLNLKNYLMHTKIKYSLIISGESIPFCISEGKASELFWFLIQHSRSIICCRCSPIQKCNIVQFVKKHTKGTTLAIGDGENDVNMIKAANVGIGIFGKEGSQAAYNSDYAFSEFKYLRILLFVNGRFSLLRNTYFLNMFFFKNFLYTFQGIILTFYSLYSGNFFYDEFYDSMFNTFVSILPLIVFSIIDEDYDPDFKRKDVDRKILLLLPDMYKQTRDSKPFNVVKYLVTSFISLIFAIIVSLIFNNSFKDIIKNEKGDISSIYELIFLTYISMLIIHFFFVYIDTSLFNSIVFIIFIIQIILDLLFVLVMNRIKNDNKLSGITSHLLSTNNFLVLIINCSFICLPFYILRRMELYFGINISNMIKANNIKSIFTWKFYTKKISQMIRAISSVNKFKRINEDFIISDKTNVNNKHYENLIDINMRKAVEHFQKNRAKIK